MLKQPVFINGFSSASALGTNEDVIWNHYKNPVHLLSKKNDAIVAPIASIITEKVQVLKDENSKYADLDNSVLFALIAARNALETCNWRDDTTFGINIGSSRGATALFEDFHKEYLNTERTATLTSPTTTLGNISSWLAHDLQTTGPTISHSITCSTALHALLNGVAWLQSGMASKFMVGGSEAPLTDFTIAQMKALKIYAIGNQDESFPCRPLDLEKKQNTMVLGEGAAVACLELLPTETTKGSVVGIGYATEPLKHNASLSTDAGCFQDSMNMALGRTKPDEIDIIITHTPGTIKGDQAEFNAINKVFRKHIPALTCNKWKIGHTLGASGMLSLEMGLLMLKHQQFIPIPFIVNSSPKKIEKILINAVGFGGNAVSVLLSK